MTKVTKCASILIIYTLLHPLVPLLQFHALLFQDFVRNCQQMTPASEAEPYSLSYFPKNKAWLQRPDRFTCTFISCEANLNHPKCANSVAKLVTLKMSSKKRIRHRSSLLKSLSVLSEVISTFRSDGSHAPMTPFYRMS